MPKKITDLDEYKSFEKQFRYYNEFFQQLADHISYNGQFISLITPTSHHFLDTSLLDSAAKSLESIRMCCSIGAFSDGNTILRKLRDDLLLYTFILDVINRRKPFIENDIGNANFSSPEAFSESLNRLQFNGEVTKDEQAVQALFSGTVEGLPSSVKKSLSFKNYMDVLSANEYIKEVLEKYNLKEYWKTLSERLNDLVHNNGAQFARYNASREDDKNVAIHLKNIQYRTAYISSVFLVLVLILHSSLISSSDHIDYLDAGMVPPEDSQYWVAPFIQEFIDQDIVKLHPELKAYLQDNNIHGMKIE